MKVDTGQIWRTKKTAKYYCLGMSKYIIILSLDTYKNGGQTEDCYLIGCYWFCEEKAWGGARINRLTDKEINESCEYIGHLKDFVKQVEPV